MRRAARNTALAALLRWSALFSASLVAGPVLAAPAAAHEVATPDASFSEFVPGAARLEGRLLAPCCWDSSRQTLDIHGSPIANELRREIRSRLKAGETPDVVEADLVRRYTTKILAVPTDSRMPKMGLLLVVALGGAFVFAATRVARWRKGADATPAASAAGVGGAGATSVRDEWDEKIDQELEERE